MIYIRADANKNIGMGHIMRCLSIADAFRFCGYAVIFILANEGVERIIKSRGYEAFILNSDYKDLESELEKWPQTPPDIIIVDSYFATHRYFLELKKISNLVCIDDLVAFPYPVDIIVDYNAYANNLDYQSLYNNSPPKLILGPKYAPLRSGFRNLKRKVQPVRVENILLSTGGADKLHLALHFVKNLVQQKANAYKYHILIGAMNTDKERIHAISKDCEFIILHENVSDMIGLLGDIDVAVSASGSTLYEICACGIPLITYVLADNQIRGAEAFDNLGFTINIGDLREKSTVNDSVVRSQRLASYSIDRIMLAIDELCNDYHKRVEIGNRMQDLIDGYGANRMAEEIVSHFGLSK